MEHPPAPGPRETPVSVSGQARVDDGQPTAVVTVRYWASIKAAAGLAAEEVTAATVADVVEQVRQRHAANPRFAQVLGVCSLLLGDRQLRGHDLASVEVTPGQVLDVLPPFAGG